MVTQHNPAPFQVVPWELFEKLQQQVADLQRRIDRDEKLRLRKSLLSAREVCEVMKVSKSTVLRLERKGEIVSVRDGKKISYRVDSIRDYLKRHTLDPAEIEDRLLIVNYCP